MSRPILLCAFAIFALLVVPRRAASQQVFGSIYGTVSDQSGAPILDATVSVTDVNKGTKFDTATNSSGNYRVGQLIPGKYRVEVQTKGFRKAALENLILNVDQAGRADFTLQIGEVTESVAVTASAPGLTADRADVATTFSARELVDLPSFDRNFQAHLLLTPGTNQVGWQHASSENPQGSRQITVNGQPFSATGFQLDGTDNQDPILGIIVINPAIDSVTETKIASQNYDAEFGMVGAGIVITSTKSGSNTFHGSAFEYLRNNSLGFQSFARNPFNSAEASQAPPVKWNQFGGTIGGRVIKNKLFFFGDEQITRGRTGSSVLTSVPTLKARNGNFSEYLYTDSSGPHNQIYDPLTGNPDGTGRQLFPNNTIPYSRLSPQAQAILKYLPAPNAVEPGGTTFRNNYAAVGSDAFDSNQWDTRWDYFINEKSSLFGRYSYAAFNQFAPGAFGILAGGPALDNIHFAGLSDVLNQSIAIGYTRTISTSLVNEFRFGFMRYRVSVLPNGLGTSPAKDAGIPGLNLDSFYTSGMPAFFINGDAGTALGYSLGTNQCNCPSNEQEQQFQFVDNVTKTLNNHSLKFGADIRHAQNLRVPSGYHRAGELSFNPGYTGFAPGAGQAVQQGIGLATFMLGQVTNFNRFVSSSTDAAERQNRLAFYGQDSWRLNRKLQINYGLRWDIVAPEYVNKAGNGALPNLNTGRMEVFGIGGIPISGQVRSNYSNFAPRLGIAYQINEKTVARIGYGWTYSLGVFGSNFGHTVTQNIPILGQQSINANGSFDSVFSLAHGPDPLVFPAVGSDGTLVIPDGVYVRSRPGQVVLPRVMAYNATVQRHLTNDMSVSVGYVGNSGRHVFIGDGPDLDLNPATWDPATSPATDYNSRRPFFQKFGWTQGVGYVCSCTTNQYNSLQIQFEKRFSQGYNFQGSYTLQYATGDSDGWSFLYDRPLGRGNRDNVTRQAFVFTHIWELPFGRGRRFGTSINRAMDLALGGWNLSGVLIIYSGRPFTPYIGTFPAGALAPDTGPNNRPDKGFADPFAGSTHDRNQFFVGGFGPGKPFDIPANNQFGNYPYNGLFGPKYVQEDLSIGKGFSITNRTKLNLRAEAFNAFNHTNLGDPIADVSADNVGQITGLAPAGQMRRLQFVLRLEF
jgi:hypothetical protein